MGTRPAGGVVSREMTIAIGNVVVKANDPSLLKKYGGPLELTAMWARGVLASLNLSKRRGTSGNVDPSEQFLREEKLTFQQNIARYSRGFGHKLRSDPGEQKMFR